MKLTRGEWSLDVDIRHGGMVRALERRGQPVLRAMPQGSTEPLDSACIPLAPYVNRIAHGRFAWNGAAYHLAPNHPDHAHPLHGTAWLRDWTPGVQDESSITLHHVHEADAHWDWSFALTQTFTLLDDGLEACLAITNTDRHTMPAALGFHPWFDRSGVSGIRFAAEKVWLSDAEMLPTDPAPADALGDWQAGAELERPDLVDHCYAGWDGTLTIMRDDGDLILEGEGTPFLHLFVPPGRDFFCAEPQTTMPDAVNRQPPAPLAPGETLAITMRIRSA
ncbi:aldose 1-epimerase [Novosphingobium sp. 9]|uniref:aldose 1-epimerase n=1 Tax=Novosphingobium sp. 9 TaxID=2025349 RepID=UPI0021B62DF4|nr:aldose 1-epimerase [Novosphingobium sp. 9]